MKLNDSIQKGKGNGQRRAYNHLMSTGMFGIAEKVKEFRKNERKKRRRK